MSGLSAKDAFLVCSNISMSSEWMYGFFEVFLNGQRLSEYNEFDKTRWFPHVVTDYEAGCVNILNAKGEIRVYGD